MILEEFTKLYERIQLDPSILLLGQNFLSMGGGKDPVWQKLVDEIYPELDLPRRQVNYPLLWEQVVKTPDDARKVMANIQAAAQGNWENDAVKVIKNLRWSLLYTSAIGGTDALIRTQGDTPVPPDERTARPQYLNKDRGFRVNLCGDALTPPPVLESKINRKTFRGSIANKIAWISNTYLEYYGVLVIDGLDPDSDWLDDELLFEQMYQMPPSSVYWFGAPDELGENAELLVERGILHVEAEGFYEHMRKHMPEVLEAAAAFDGSESDDALYTSLSLRFKGATRTVRISRAGISEITGTNLCIIDDEAMQTTRHDTRPRADLFANFLMQDNLPAWSLFNTADGDTSFYIPRDCDEPLEKALLASLNNTSTSRRPILLHGPSNSGKSMALANLAFRTAKKRHHPVIYIRGDMASNAIEKLKGFIKNWFGNPEHFDGELVKRVLVFWDGSGLKRSGRDYAHLQEQLFAHNVQVVGSAYAPSFDTENIEMKQDLSAAEINCLRNVLRSLGDTYYVDRFDEIRKHSQRAADLPGNNSLLYLLQSLFKHEFDTEYKTLQQLLSRQFNSEKSQIEQETGSSLKQYVDEFFEVQKQAVKDGPASSFHEALRQLLIQSDKATQDAATPEEMEAAAQNAGRIAKFKQLDACIEKVNNILAVASQFDVRLPLKLLLRFLRDEHGVSLTYSAETAKLIEILRRDTFISFERISHERFGEGDYVRFRNAIEAENHICLAHDLPLGDRSDNRKEKEVALLKEIIETAVGDQELRSVIELVRQFGPNGHGKLSELENGYNRRTRGDYTEYKNYWLDIAKALIAKFGYDAEATLVYAHFIRETVRQVEGLHKTYYDDLQKAARTRLEDALAKLDNEGDHQHSRQQYARLSVELCANYQQDMLDNGYDDVRYREIVLRVRNAFLMSRGQDSGEIRRDFTSNSMLDILLNAFDTRCAYMDELRRKDLDKFKADDAELAEMVGYIDEMLNLDDLVNDSRIQLIDKIKGVYARLSNEDEQLEKLQQNLLLRGSDAYLYLQARILWQSDDLTPPPTADRSEQLCYGDRYILLCSDFPLDNRVITEKLAARMRLDAERVVAYLEEHDDIIRKTKSERCVIMLMRAKWFLRTGNLLLGERQLVALTPADWTEITSLCGRYLLYHASEKREEFIPAHFYMGIYEWIYGDGREAVNHFNTAKSLVHGNQRRTSITRFVLCAEGTTTPRTFQVNVQRNMNEKYTAQIRTETSESTGNDQVLGRFGMGVSKVVLEKYLFDGSIMREAQRQAFKDVTVQFNLIGAQIMPPSVGGFDNE